MPIDRLSGLRDLLPTLRVYVALPLHDSYDFIDTTARLNGLCGELTELLNAAKCRIKEQAIRDNLAKIEGRNFVANLKAIEVTRLDTDRVKSFLGTRISSYQITSTEQRLTFKPFV